MFADIIVPLAVDGIYTYAVPSDLLPSVVEGSLVIVEFGKSKKYTGLIIRLHDREPTGYAAKSIEGVADGDVRFLPDHIRFLLWMGEYYMSTPGETLRAALPVVFRLESLTNITLSGDAIDYSLLNRHEKEMVHFLRPGEYISLTDIEKRLKIKNGMPLFKSLLDKRVIRIKEIVNPVFYEKQIKVVKAFSAFCDKEWHDFLDSLKRAPAQYQMLCRWIEMKYGEISRQEFLKACGGTAATLKILCDKHILATEDRTLSRLESEGTEEEVGFPLSEIQSKALEEIKQKFNSHNYVLFKGVTSSGKTEIYIHLIKEYIKCGKQVLYMLPEIALTVQIVRRLKRVFGDRVGVYHSGTPDMERAELWKKQCGKSPYPLILGVRSSVFLPFSNLGLVIVDEEHDLSYKQKDPAPRYNGRDAAVMAAKFYGAKVLLGSATPSFESYENAKTGKYQLVSLNQRYGDVKMPELLLADLTEFRRKKQMKKNFSPPLYEAIKEALAKNKQVILFQNRKGYSTYLQCDACGTILKCKNCDVSMTYYKQRGVSACHYCGSINKAVDVCNECGQGHYRYKTPGTERIEEEIGELFPEARIGRMDAEMMSSRSKYGTVIKDFEAGNTDILIGTQMISKGLDFENVQLVGVIDADNIVNFPDFRSEERAYNLLMQVSGRSGRKKEQGKVIIQASDVKKRIYTYLAEDRYELFYESLSEERRFFGYPPYTRILQIELRYKNEATLRNAANTLTVRLREKFGRRLAGPSVPEIGRINREHRIRLLLKVEAGISYAKTKIWLKKEFSSLTAQKEYGGIRIICDVDPC